MLNIKNFLKNLVKYKLNIILVITLLIIIIFCFINLDYKIESLENNNSELNKSDQNLSDFDASIGNIKKKLCNNSNFTSVKNNKDCLESFDNNECSMKNHKTPNYSRSGNETVNSQVREAQILYQLNKCKNKTS